ncbi:transcription termination/antitermination protein NusG [Selenomonas sp. F0473]|uniref:transcription termination/antitermination protein NusG n=1 Tax=Selenomonas sp. F0473 TaxID=999423 RepID=UPI00029E550F|nr:transcription termination/antitermination protein NusG [Selenomonas sp. F0473]EKU70726.1 transcription termination/antitermination factor NusG [Selenomonas sp. F0473]
MADKEELYLRQANPHRAWYVIHTYSGYENKVKANLERLMHSASMSDMLFNVVVPVEDEIEVRDGKEKVVPRKVFPGYVLVDMIVDEHSWYVVRNTTGVTGFVGSEKHPIPLTAEEAERILSGAAGSAPKRRAKVSVGDNVRIASGAFEDYAGKVMSIDSSGLRIQVDIEGTPIDVEINQVEVI